MAPSCYECCSCNNTCETATDGGGSRPLLSMKMESAMVMAVTPADSLGRLGAVMDAGESQSYSAETSLLG